ncbi:hypothetical protein ON010_g13787 [Phytophthora cinnamomi]|nr:hypothetical protein ON010_g13787 [Phytophthora cinnamomi]
MPSSSSSPGGPRGRVAQRRGSSAEAALQAEVARLGVPDGVLKRGFLVKKGHVLPTRKERDGDVELKGVLELKASDVISPLPHSDVWLRVRQIEGPRGKSYKLDLKVHAQSSRRGQNAKAMAELLSAPLSPDNASTPRVDLRASFQILHEMLLLKKLVDTIKSSWGPPSQWTMAQYQELVQGICLAQEKAGSSEFGPDSILAEAFKLRYQFEEIPDNQRKLSSDDDPLGAAQPTVERLQNDGLDSPVSTSRASPRIRCPSFHSYYANFEGLSGRGGDAIQAAGSNKEGAKVLTPRGATLAKYAHLYLLDDIRAKQPWSLDRTDDDDIIAKWKGGQ